ALAGARGTDDRDRLARRHAQVQAVEHMGTQLALGVGLAQALGAQRLLGMHGRLTHSAAPPPAGYGPRARRDRAWPGSSSPAPPPGSWPRRRSACRWAGR